MTRLPQLPNRLDQFHGYTISFTVGTRDVRLRCEHIIHRTPLCNVCRVKVFDAGEDLAHAFLRIDIQRFGEESEGYPIVECHPIAAVTNVECSRAIGGHGIGVWLWDSVVALLPEFAALAPRRIRHIVTQKPINNTPLDKWRAMFEHRIAKYQEIAGSAPRQWFLDIP